MNGISGGSGAMRSGAMHGVRGSLILGSAAVVVLAAIGTTAFLLVGSTTARDPPSLSRGLPPIQSAAAAVSPVQCPFETAPGKTVRCGSIAVPESWARPDSPKVKIFYAITPADGPGPRQPDPVLVLNGGPGQSGSELIAGAWEKMAEIRHHRDIVFVDQRGTGFSEPGLFCPDMDPIAFWHGGLTAQDAENCRRRIEDQGYKLANFNTWESALDLVALRRALGIGVWNLHGTSYGTVLAMEAVRQDPAGVRSVILNSPSLTRASWLDIGRMAAIERVFKLLFQDCRDDPACGTAFPDLDAVFRDLADRLRLAPISITYTNPRTGREVAASMDFNSLLNVLTILVGSGQAAARVPQMLWHIHQVAEGEVPPHMPLLAWLYMPYWEIMANLAYGLNAAIGCREVRPWVDADGARSMANLFWPYVSPSLIERDYDVFCPVWNLTPAPESLRVPVRSDVPALLLTGLYDTLTPTGLADEVAGHLSRSRVLRFRGLGHDIYAASACARGAVASFISDPAGFSEPGCVATAGPPDFVTGSGPRTPGRAEGTAP